VDVMLGTAAYMSPEQASGRGADKRSNVWAFGCVLYEMLSGKRAFNGESVPAALAAVLRDEPDWSALTANVPPAVRALIQGCLRRDRKTRVGDLSTASFLLAELQVPVEPSARAPVSSVVRRLLLVTAGAAIGAAIAAALLLWNRVPAPAVPMTRFAITLPRGSLLNPQRQAVDISPNGSRIVFATTGGLFVRPLADLQARLLPGTDGAVNPVFSPDGLP
jgi:serine/threonine protein kinase